MRLELRGCAARCEAGSISGVQRANPVTQTHEPISSRLPYYFFKRSRLLGRSLGVDVRLNTEKATKPFRCRSAVADNLPQTRADLHDAAATQTFSAIFTLLFAACGWPFLGCPRRFCTPRNRCSPFPTRRNAVSIPTSNACAHRRHRPP